MDIRCSICGEPWDSDELHEIARADGVPFDATVALFRSKGCSLICSAPWCKPTHQGEVAAEVAALSGDVDGWASDLADAEALGLL